jgi:hypothetical protein
MSVQLVNLLRADASETVLIAGCLRNSSLATIQAIRSNFSSKDP